MDWLTHEIGLRIKQVCKGLDIPVGDLSRLAQTIPSLAIDLQGLAFDVRGQDYIFLDHKAPAREKKLGTCTRAGAYLAWAFTSRPSREKRIALRGGGLQGTACRCVFHGTYSPMCVWRIG